MGNWQTRDRKRNKKNQDRSHKKFYGESKSDSRIDKNIIRERRKQVELENGGESENE
tara:strand:- start:895 stop:1065 length:171 start_codon:yes stop_codon:yes gene_type:complete